MIPKAPLHSFKFTRGQVKAQSDRLAEEASESEGMPEHARKASDPILWEAGRLVRTGGHYVYVSDDRAASLVRGRLGRSDT